MYRQILAKDRIRNPMLREYHAIDRESPAEDSKNSAMLRQVPAIDRLRLAMDSGKLAETEF
jgi:hypothetical protein